MKLAKNNLLFLFFLLFSICIISYCIKPKSMNLFQRKVSKFAQNYQKTTQVNKIIEFSNYTWYVRTKNAQPQGPGPNYFSDSYTNVNVDAKGYLNVKITYADNKWYCSQVFLSKSLGYGSYIFNVEKEYEKLDVKAVLGLFTYLDDDHEIDVEISQWNNPLQNTTQYVVQPYGTKGNILRFTPIPFNISVVHAFTWGPKNIFFQSFYADYIQDVLSEIGKQSQSFRKINQWDYKGLSNPLPSTQKVHINLWLYKGEKPINGLQQQITIKQFMFVPFSQAQTKIHESEI